MKEKIKSLKSAKYIVLAVFAVLSIVCILLMGKVRINYNISDYLDDETDTKISLGIMEEEFELVSNIQVMISDIGVDEAEEIKSKINSVNNVKVVNFDSQNSDYYKDNTALFVVLVEGNEYSDEANTALADIKAALDEDYGSRMELGGTVMEKQLLREAIQGEIVMILAISLCLVAFLMLFTAKSWIEPLVLLAASGVAVLINMGTNVIFGEISYITNAVAAILQLALSIDYSIVLLHAYRDIKQSESDNERAMLRAIKDVARPVSASSLTTIAGLLALLFMSFAIGFDIGIVLMKSIVISAITSLTLLPAFLIFFDKLMQKTAKKSMLFNGEKLASVSIKHGKIIVPIASFVIVAACVLNIFNAFSFTDSSNSNEKIGEKFGESGTLIVLYENAADAAEKEALLTALLESYRLENGSPVLKNQVSYSTTVGQVFDVEKASNDLGVSIEDAKLLFTVYRFAENGSYVKIDSDTFVSFALDLIENDEAAKDFVSDPKLLELLALSSDLYENEYTAEELISLLTSHELTEDPELIALAVNQIYGNHFFDDVENKSASLEDMLGYVMESDLLDDETKGQINQLLSIKNKIKAIELPAPSEDIAYEDFKALVERINEVTGINILGSFGPKQAWNMIAGSTKSLKAEELFAKFFSKIDQFSLDEMLSMDINELLGQVGIEGNAEGYRVIYGLIDGVMNVFEGEYTHTQLREKINEVIAITPEQFGLTPIPEEADFLIKQIHIMYYGFDGRIPQTSARLIDMLDTVVELTDRVIELSESGDDIKNALPEGTTEFLVNVKEDILALDALLADDTVRSYEEMSEIIADFIAGIKCYDLSVEVPETLVLGTYVKYAAANDAIETGSIAATDLLAFVVDAADNNELLSGRIDDDMKKVIKDAEAKLKSAEALLVGKNYSRMLLTVNLPPESEESSAFVEYLSSKVREIFGDNAYVAGEIATTNDLINAFDYDNTFISIFTVVSIFVIILIVFKSISFPIILVAVIQGAIWIAMAMSLVAGPIFFMSYIMSMCILMGATIDYGILLSTNYVRNREAFDKKESLYKAVTSALPTVFTSGLILMVCGLVVGLIASQTSISSVGFLLFRGTLVSVVMVLLVLPALLYLLDKFVMKFTMKEDCSLFARFLKKKSSLDEKNTK